MTMLVTVKVVYGEQRIYPACDVAEGFATLLGQKTFTAKNIANIRSIGIEVSVAQPVISV